MRPRTARAAVPLLAGLLLAVAGPPSAAPAQAAAPVAPRLLAASAVSAPGVLRGSGKELPAVRGRSALRAAGRASATSGEVRSTWSVSYTGFSATQRAAFQAAVDTWSHVLSSPVTISVDAHLQPLDPGVLGSAGPTSFAVDDADGRYGPEDTLRPIALANALAGRDLAPGQADISADFSNDASLFSYGTTAQTGRYDFTTVVLHEIAHGLGFAGAMDVLPDAAGTRRGYWDPGTTQPRPLAYDRKTVRLAADGSTTPLLDLPRGSTVLADALTGGSLRWHGAAGTAADHGTAPVLYAPATWEEGSSYSHLDERTYPSGTPDALMTPMLDLGEMIRDPGDIALGMLADVGWQTASPGLRLSAPTVADAGASVPVTGAATPGAAVQLYVHVRGATATSAGAQPGYSLSRTVLTGSNGVFTTTFVVADDQRVYARVADQVSEGVLTQVRPTFDGPATRVVRRGTTLVLAGRGQPSTRLALRFTRGTEVDVTRGVAVGADGRWRRPVTLTADLRVAARGANGRPGAGGLLLQAR